MTREDRELLAELARLNTDLAPLGMRIMEGSAGAAEQGHYATRLITAGARLRRRAAATGWLVTGEGEVVEGEVVPKDEAAVAPRDDSLALPPNTVEPIELDWRP